ncbi:MAG TPA: oligosaccharide flippase family protein, partial [Bacilli bacterium]
MKKISKLNPKLIGPTLLIIAQYTTQIIGPLVSLLVIRYLGPEQFGLYASAMAITALLSVLPDFGLQQAALNLNARRQWSITGIVKKFFGVGLIYATLSYILVAILFQVIDFQWTTQIVGLILGLTFFRISLVTVLNTSLQIQGNYGRMAFWNMLIGSTQWISTLICIFMEVDIFGLVLGPIIVSLIATCFMFLFQGKEIKMFLGGSGASSIEKVPLGPLLKGSWQFGLASSMHQLYYKSDVAVLSVFRQPFEVGQYMVAFRLVELFFLFPGVVFNQVLYPKYCIWCRENIPK